MTTNAGRLDGKTAIITGGSQGIGRATALRFAEEGASVVVADVNEENGRATVAEIEDAGGEAVFVATDVTEMDDAEALVEAAVDAFGTVDVLVNNAGITRDNLLLRMKPEEWSDVLDTNVGGLYRLCRRVLRPMMKARFGRIVNLSSVVARMGNAGQANYAASKAAIEGFTRALAQEVGSRGITVNAIAPGFIETEMTASIDDAQREALRARVPLGRLGRAEEVAALAVFLASEQAGYVTGETVHVNGGLYTA
jgi:3-oxoacyl-[acyl-carrier protein] reductase